MKLEELIFQLMAAGPFAVEFMGPVSGNIDLMIWATITNYDGLVLAEDLVRPGEIFDFIRDFLEKVKDGPSNIK